MRAIVTKPFRGCKDGELHPVDLAEGDIVEGDLAKEAVIAGWAEDAGGKAPKEKKPPKNKAGWVPKNKAAADAGQPDGDPGDDDTSETGE